MLLHIYRRVKVPIKKRRHYSTRRAAKERFGRYLISRAIVLMSLSPIAHSKRLICRVVALSGHFKEQTARETIANVGRKRPKFALYYLVISDDTAFHKYSASSMITIISAAIK